MLKNIVFLNLNIFSISLTSISNSNSIISKNHLNFYLDLKDRLAFFIKIVHTHLGFTRVEIHTDILLHF